MAKIVIGGAGGAPSEGVIKSLIRAQGNDVVIGIGSEPTDLALSAASRKYCVPRASDAGYRARLLEILDWEKPDLAHFQNDLEIFNVSLIRDDIRQTGTKLFIPPHDVIDTCVHKYKSYIAFRAAGLPVPRNIVISNESDLRRAFADVANEEGCLWLRDGGIGGGGKGALPTADYSLAKAWIERNEGWGSFIAAEMLSAQSVTWLSIWHQGELIVAQSRARRGWVHGNRSPSGVTGVTKVGVTCDDPEVTEIATQAVKAVAAQPHGIFGVDMTYNREGVPNPTEINISRFFTTVLFFTTAGLNMPEIFKDLAIHGKRPSLTKNINPLPSGLMWLRGMDVEPRLVTEEDLLEEIRFQ